MILLYPGSFDPVTNGHIDIALRGVKLAKELIVSVVDNPNKNSFFSVDERKSLLKNAFHGYDNIEIESFSGLLADYARTKGVTAILRGLRTPADFEAESRYAIYNKMLSTERMNEIEANGIETIFITASPNLSYISSSIVREAAMYIYKNDTNSKTALETMVPTDVITALERKCNL